MSESKFRKGRGFAIGLAMDNLAVGPAIGLAIGAGLGAFMERSYRKNATSV